jgi:hypothetical protein
MNTITTTTCSVVGFDARRNISERMKRSKRTESHDEDSILLGQDAASLEGNPHISAVENSKLAR